MSLALVYESAMLSSRSRYKRNVPPYTNDRAKDCSSFREMSALARFFLAGFPYPRHTIHIASTLA